MASSQPSTLGTQNQGKGNGKKSAKKQIHEDTSSSDDEYDSKKILEELKATIKSKPCKSASPEPQFLAGYGAHPPVHMGAASIRPFFPPPPPPMYPPYTGAHYYMPSHYGYSIPLDLSNNSEHEEEI